METFVADGIYIDSPPERVFASLHSAEDMLVWLDAERVEVDARAGGSFSARCWDGSTVRGTFKSLEDPASLQIENWHHVTADGVERGPMRVSFTLSPRFGGVWIMVRQDDLDQGPDWKKYAMGMEKVWRQATVALKRHIDQI